MLRVDFGGVDWFFWFTWGRISTERREREEKQQSFCNEEELTHFTYS